MADRDTLFVKKDFVMHSGGLAHYKIECDALTDKDLDTLAFVVANKAKLITGENRTGIRQVYGVPRGGVRFAEAFQPYLDTKWGTLRLIVDDVLTTGKSMEEARLRIGWGDAIGVVIFARHDTPNWIKPIFQMSWFNTKDEWNK